MSNEPKPEENKEPKAPDIKQKRYSIMKEEQQEIMNLQSVLGVLAILREGVNNSMMLKIMGIRQRLHISEADTPIGYMRDVKFDSQTYELIVTDVPKPPEPKKDEKVENDSSEAKK